MSLQMMRVHWWLIPGCVGSNVSLFVGGRGGVILAWGFCGILWPVVAVESRRSEGFAHAPSPFLNETMFLTPYPSLPAVQEAVWTLSCRGRARDRKATKMTNVRRDPLLSPVLSRSYFPLPLLHTRISPFSVFLNLSRLLLSSSTLLGQFLWYTTVSLSFYLSVYLPFSFPFLRLPVVPLKLLSSLPAGSHHAAHLSCARLMDVL